MKKETRKIGSCYKVSSQASAVYLPSNAISFAICAGVHGYAMGNILVKKKSNEKRNPTDFI